METVRVKKDQLLSKVRENRRAHRDLFLKAQEGYREKVIEELDIMLRDAREGKKIRRGISLPEPIDQTRDYDRVVAMLEMSVDEYIELNPTEFAQYVLDDWQWKANTMHINSSYLAR